MERKINDQNTDSYTPEFGDRFHKPAGSYRTAQGEMKEMPERNALVTAISHDHVVVVVDGLEHTRPHSEFLRLARKTLQGGATLIRQNNKTTDEATPPHEGSRTQPGTAFPNNEH